METLWDLDLDAAARAVSLGLTFERTSVPNEDVSFIDALEWAVVPLL